MSVVVLRDEGSCPIEDMVDKLQTGQSGLEKRLGAEHHSQGTSKLRNVGYATMIGVLSLTDAGREWANRIHWNPEVLVKEPEPDVSGDVE